MPPQGICERSARMSTPGRTEGECAGAFPGQGALPLLTQGPPHVPSEEGGRRQTAPVPGAKGSHQFHTLQSKGPF